MLRSDELVVERGGLVIGERETALGACGERTLVHR
jgi:hypothetical protein